MTYLAWVAVRELKLNYLYTDIVPLKYIEKGFRYSVLRSPHTPNFFLLKGDYSKYIMGFPNFGNLILSFSRATPQRFLLGPQAELP